MNSSLANAKTAVVVFVMEGCPACDEYKPRFERLVGAFQAHHHPFVIYEEGTLIQPGQIPVIVLDAASEDESVISMADTHKIEALPTTLILGRTIPVVKLEGAIEDAQLRDALIGACIANR